ncbi:regulatory protein ral2 [Mycena rebaudengoi]|nr:regulatory protein ral2 [Mycena rebaudengoi]
MLNSIYDLTTFYRKTTGDVPAKLVGASTTVVGSKMYLFGGRLVTERRMVADLYVFDLETYNWEKIPPFPEDDVPKARYFHSVDTWNNQLIVFGGMSNQPESPNPDELCVLNDVRFFDIATRHWLPPSRIITPENLLPRARYAQLSSVTRDRLFIIGGQDFYNTWHDVCVYDLLAKTWSEKRDYPRHCGSYRSVAVSSSQVVRFPKEEMRASRIQTGLGSPGTRFQQGDPKARSLDDFTPLPYSAPPNDEHPSDIYLYSNYNFTDVKCELELFSPLPDTGFTIEDRSAAMSGTTFPPGLRFPTGAVLGTHLIIAGIYLAHSYQSFSIWVLDLQTMVWSRIDPGKAVESGSWFRGCLWPEANKFMIFGNKNGNLVDDYNRRLLSWDHVAVVDLEAFGIYQPPALRLEIPMQELRLAALKEQVLTDFEIVCDDGRKVACSRRLLEDRWPWFKEQRLRLLQTALQTMEALPSSPMHVPLPELPGGVRASDNDDDNGRPDPRLTPRAFHLSEPYPITLALLQYFYTLALVTPLQTAPAVLSQLLVLATNYRITHLATLVKHAMHRALSNSTSVGVYEVATLCSCRSLQIRALKTVMSYTQKKPSRSRGDKDGGGGGGGGGGGRPADGGGGGGGGDRLAPSSNNNHGPSFESKYVSRPRRTSDARWGNSSADKYGNRCKFAPSLLFLFFPTQ